jgi:hypothetical protein
MVVDIYLKSEEINSLIINVICDLTNINKVDVQVD